MEVFPTIAVAEVPTFTSLRALNNVFIMLVLDSNCALPRLPTVDVIQWLPTLKDEALALLDHFFPTPIIYIHLSCLWVT